MIVKEINNLVKQSFGRFYSVETDERGLLRGIEKFVTGNIGMFLNFDGSDLTVEAPWEKQAKKYARLYQEKFDKPASIGIYPGGIF